MIKPNFAPQLKYNGKRIYNVKSDIYNFKDAIWYEECEPYTDYRIKYMIMFDNNNNILYDNTIFDKYGNLIETIS